MSKVVEKTFNEVIVHGGLPMRRIDVYRLESGRGFPSTGIGSPDWWAFRPTVEVVEGEGWPLDRAREILDG